MTSLFVEKAKEFSKNHFKTLPWPTKVFLSQDKIDKETRHCLPRRKKKKKPKKERGIQEPSQITKHHEDGIANRMTPSIDRSIAI